MNRRISANKQWALLQSVIANAQNIEGKKVISSLPFLYVNGLSEPLKEQERKEKLFWVDNSLWVSVSAPSSFILKVKEALVERTNV